MDWDNIDACDILAMFTSFCKGDMLITKVEIYPSLYGLEQMKKDTLYGPSIDVYNKEIEKDEKKKKEYEEQFDYLEDEELENGEGFDQSKLRKYEL